MNTEDREQLRLALVMNGGVSLAVWMGGVSNEIFRVVTARHPVYAGLLDLTHSVARVDSISGTSAGGINGAALAVALLYGGDLSRLRRIWREMGSFGSLLRSPFGDNPGSLLRGDDYFLPRITEALKDLAPQPMPQWDPERMPLDLRLTTTLLSGQQGHNVDALGEWIHDVDYRAHFHFQHGLGSGPSDFADRDQIIPKLALAARSTASFPFAFEPTRVPGPKSDPQTHGLKDARGEPITDGSRYVVDGGLLNNKPFQGALDAIFRMPRYGGVRRVLAYINPDPGDGPPNRPSGKLPCLGDVLGASLFGIPNSQTIADQLTAIREHNDRVRTRRESVLSIVRSGMHAQQIAQLAQTLFPIYRQRRVSNTFEQYVYDALPGAARRHASLRQGLSALGTRGRTHMKLAFESVPWSDWLPPSFPNEADNTVEGWRWGLFPVEFACRVLLEMLRITQDLADRRSGAALEPVPAPQMGDLPGKPDWEDPNTLRACDKAMRGEPVSLRDSWRAVQSAAAHGQGASCSLRDHWVLAYALVHKIARKRDRERPDWDQRTDRLLQRLFDVFQQEEIDKRDGRPKAPCNPTPWLREQFVEMFGFLGEPSRRMWCGRTAYQIADAVRALCCDANAIAQACIDDPACPPQDRARAESLRALTQYFCFNGPDRGETIERLLQLEVIEYAFNDHDSMTPDTEIELVQMSSNGASPLGGQDEPREKLLGLQFAHFAAFYKQSWRANDWLYGRLDSSQRLIKVLLNPHRLHQLHHGPGAAAAVAARIKHIAVDSVPSALLREQLQRDWDESGYGTSIARELAYLDGADYVPDRLPVCAEAVTRRLHYGILREELPELHDAIERDQADGADASGLGQALKERLAKDRVAARAQGAAAYVFSPRDAARQLQDGLVGGEKLIDEAGSDLFTRTLSHSLATLQATLSSKQAALGPVSVFFAAMKMPFLGFFLVARGLTHQSRTSAALQGAMLTAGVMLVLLSMWWGPAHLASSKSMAAPLTMAGWAMFGYGMAMSVVSRPRITALILGLLTVSAYVWTTQTLFLVVPALIVLLMLSVRSLALQVLGGLALILAAAAWHTGLLSFTWPSFGGVPSIGWFAFVAVGAIVWGMFMASDASAWMERFLRAAWRWMTGLDGRLRAWVSGKLAARSWRRGAGADVRPAPTRADKARPPVQAAPGAPGLPPGPLPHPSET